MPAPKAEKTYTMKHALADAAKLLQEQFGGEAHQHAAVALATFLYTAHEREEFLKSRPEADGTAYGAPFR
jgi:hypothetical protein